MANLPLPLPDLGPVGPADELVALYSLSPALGGAAATFTDAVYSRSCLPLRVREAARIRIAHLNGCQVCLASRPADPSSLTDDGPAGVGLSELEYAAVAPVDDVSSLSPRERLAVELAERFALDHQGLDPEFWDRANKLFSPQELFELLVCCAAWVGLGRVTQVSGVHVACPLTL